MAIHQIRPSHWRRALRAPVMGALVLGLSGVLALPSGAATGDPSDLVEGCDGAPSASGDFSDYNTLDAREKTVVDCLSDGYKGNKSSTDFVLQGSGGRVNFDQTISRAQFAAILNRVGDYLGLDPESGNPNNPTFADVPANHFFFDEIEELFARGLTNGAGNDTQDVDNDGNTSEPIYNPNGEVSYAQILAFVYRLLVDGAGETLATDQSHGEANGLDCGFFDNEKTQLDNAGFLIFENTPSDCRTAAQRGLVFDLIGVSFDQTVESGTATNPFAPEFGSISLAADPTSTSVGQTITATVTVLDVDDQPVQGQRVEVFGVDPDDDFTNSGDPKDPGDLTVGNTGRYGTGATPAVIDGSDPVTDAEGKVTVSVGITGSTSGSFDLYAFQGDNGDDYKGAKGTDGQATKKVTVTFNAPPAALRITSPAPGHTLAYGTTHNVSFQLIDSQGNDVKSEGQQIAAEVYRTNDCAATNPTNPQCDGTERKFSIKQLTTDANGKATWTIDGAPDPDGSTNGDSTVDRFHATLDQNGDQIANDDVTGDDLEITFIDSEPGGVDVATISFQAGNNPNKLDETGQFVGTQLTMIVKVTDAFGNPSNGIGVRFERNVTNFHGEVFTDPNGIATYTIQDPPASPTDWTYAASIDENGDHFYAASELNASTPEGTSRLTINWVSSPPAIATYPSQNVVGFSTTSGSSYIDIDLNARRVPFDNADDQFSINGDPATYSQFAAALNNDAESNDTVQVNQYQQGGISIFSMTVNGAGGPVGFP